MNLPSRVSSLSGGRSLPFPSSHSPSSIPFPQVVTSSLRRSVSLPALILWQINASLSSRRFTNQADVLVQDDRSRAEARTIRNSNENRPLNLPLSLFSTVSGRARSSSAYPRFHVSRSNITLTHPVDTSSPLPFVVFISFGPCQL